MCVRERVCVHVCVCERGSLWSVHVCVCVCVCVRERERVCVCVCWGGSNDQTAAVLLQLCSPE